MAFQLVKTTTFVYPCQIQQIDGDGKIHTGKLKVRFNKISREKWTEITSAEQDDDRLLFDVLVDKLVDSIDDGNGGSLSDEDAVAAVRADLSLTGQIVDQGLEVLFGAAAKNARRSRGR